MIFLDDFTDEREEDNEEGGYGTANSEAARHHLGRGHEAAVREDGVEEGIRQQALQRPNDHEIQPTWDAQHALLGGVDMSGAIWVRASAFVGAVAVVCDFVPVEVPGMFEDFVAAWCAAGQIITKHIVVAEFTADLSKHTDQKD